MIVKATFYIFIPFYTFTDKDAPKKKNNMLSLVISFPEEATNSTEETWFRAPTHVFRSEKIKLIKR